MTGNALEILAGLALVLGGIATWSPACAAVVFGVFLFLCGWLDLEPLQRRRGR